MELNLFATIPSYLRLKNNSFEIIPKGEHILIISYCICGTSGMKLLLELLPVYLSNSNTKNELILSDSMLMSEKSEYSN